MFLSLSVCLYLSVCLSASVIHLITLKLVLLLDSRSLLISTIHHLNLSSSFVIYLPVIEFREKKKKKKKKRARKKENDMTINRRNRRFVNGVFSLNGFLLSNGTQVGSFKYACLQQYHRYLYTIYIHIYPYSEIVCCVERDVFREICSLARGLHHDSCMGLARKVTSSFKIEQKIIRKSFFFISFYFDQLIKKTNFFDFLFI